MRYYNLISKVTFCLIFLGLMAVGPTNAQNFEGSLLGGLNATQVSGDELGGFDKLSFFGGVGVEYPFNDQWGIEAEMLYSRKGSQVGNQDDFNQSNLLWEKLKVNYVEVPFLAKYHHNENLSFHLGPSIGYLISYEVIPGNDDQRDFKNFEIGFYGGLDYHFADRFSLLIRYGNSLDSIGTKDSNPIWSFRNTGFINTVAAFGLRYQLGEL